jgi:TRAP-type C4-dicarboxylate transport system permease small subunit
MARRALGWIDRAIEVAACLLIATLLTTVLLGVLTRAWNDPLAWTDELARFLMVWLAMAGWILCTRKRGHVRIRFFQNLLPTRVAGGLEIVIQCGMLILGLLAVWFGVDLVRRNADLDATSLPISMAWIYAPLVPAGLATALQAVSEAAAPFRRTP